MRKIISIIAGAFLTGSLFAGGLVTNTNQSATWVRMPSRNASTETDAVYYNPAGLMSMKNGLHFSLNNQTVFQTRTVESSYQFLNSGTYKGTVFAPVFPSIYAAFKMDKFAFSAAFLPIGGGGGATYKTGLPSFEMSQSDLVPALAESMKATAYKMDVYFKGSSVFFGYQGAVSYKINDWVSASVGARYVTAKNTYEGYLRNIQVNTALGWLPASAVMTNVSSLATAGGNGLQSSIDEGAGNYTAAQLVAIGLMTTTQRDDLYKGLASFGVSDATSLTIAQSQAVFYGAAQVYANKATLLSDQQVNAEQTGSGVTPFINVNITPGENFNIAIKYEMATKLELTNKTTKDLTTGFVNENPSAPITKFPNGAKVRSDMPAMLTVGAELRLANIKVNAGANYYFDRSSDYGHYADLTPQNSSDYPTHLDNGEIIASNGFSLQAGAEFPLTNRLLASAGYVYSNQGANSLYQSDLTYGLATHTLGVGGAFALTENFKLNVGGSFTKYVDDSKMVDHYLGPINMLPTETYKKQSVIIGVGLDMSF